MDYTNDDFQAHDTKVLAHTKKGWLTYNTWEWNLYLRVGSKYNTSSLVEHFLVLADNLYQFEINTSEEEEEELRSGLDYDHPIVQDITQRIIDKVLM